MPSLTKILFGIVALSLSVACTTTKGRKTASAAEAIEGATTYLDWLPLEARLADLGTPVDEATRNQVVALKIAVEERQHELSEWIVPLLGSYLPRGERLRGRVVFDMGRASPLEITPNGIAYIDATAPEWKTDPERLWTEVVGALYRCALTQSLPVRLGEPKNAESFAEVVLLQLMVDGLATYVISQGALLQHDSTPDVALMLRDEKSERFQKLEGVMALAKKGSPAETQELWKKLQADEPKDRLFGIAGAAMAEAIEARESRVFLMDAVSLGHRAFYHAYMDGRPGALLSFHLPAEAVAPVDELPPPPPDADDSAH